MGGGGNILLKLTKIKSNYMITLDLIVFIRSRMIFTGDTLTVVAPPPQFTAMLAAVVLFVLSRPILKALTDTCRFVLFVKCTDFAFDTLVEKKHVSNFFCKRSGVLFCRGGVRCRGTFNGRRPARSTTPYNSHWSAIKFRSCARYGPCSAIKSKTFALGGREDEKTKCRGGRYYTGIAVRHHHDTRICIRVKG